MERLNQDQLFNVVNKHVWDCVDRMSKDELKETAADQLTHEFLASDGKFDQIAVLEALLTEFEGDTDLMRGFIISQCPDVKQEDLDPIIAKFMA